VSHQSHGRRSEPLSRTVAERAEEARLEDAREHEERIRSRRELGLELSPPSCRLHGNNPATCPLCRDWTVARHVGVDLHTRAA